MINLTLQDKATGDGRGDRGGAGHRKSGNHRTRDRKRQRMRHEEARVADGTRRAQRSRPAKLVAQQLARAALGAFVGNDRRRDRDRHAGGAHGYTHRLVVSELSEKRLEAADRLKRLAAQRNRRSETRLRKSERQADEYARQEVIIDRHRRQPRPQAGARVTAVKVRDEADTRTLERADRSRQIVAL